MGKITWNGITDFVDDIRDTVGDVHDTVGDISDITDSITSPEGGDALQSIANTVGVARDTVILGGITITMIMTGALVLGATRK